jgi:hypothetical protein
MWSCSKQSISSVEQKHFRMGGADLRFRNAGNLNIREKTQYLILMVSCLLSCCRFMVDNSVRPAIYK